RRLRARDPAGVSFHALESRVRPLPAPDLRDSPPLDPDDVRREVVRAPEERRADAVDVDRYTGLLEGADLVHGEAARGDDAHVLEAVVVESRAHVPHQAFVDAARIEVAELLPERAVDQ